MKLHEPSHQLSALIQRSGDSVVQVSGRARLPATGVVWSSENDRALVLTANHVLEHGHSLHITLADGERIAAQIIGRAPQHDLALLQIPRAAQPAHWAADVAAPSVGEMVLAVGRPFGSLEASLGIIRAPAVRESRKVPDVPNSETTKDEEAVSEDRQSRKGTPPWSDDFDVDDPWQDTIEKLGRSAERAVQHAEEIAKRAVRNFEWRLENEGNEEEGWHPGRRHRKQRRLRQHRGRPFPHMQKIPAGALPIDLTLYPGFSGGPLLGLDGQVLGINTSAFGSSLALSTSVLRESVAALQEQKPNQKRAFLGVSGQSVRLPSALANELRQEAGLLLTSVQAGSAAEAAGLLLGDILLALDDERVTTLRELHAALTAERIGKPLIARLVRAGGLREVSVWLGERS